MEIQEAVSSIRYMRLSKIYVYTEGLDYNLKAGDL